MICKGQRGGAQGRTKFLFFLGLYGCSAVFYCSKHLGFYLLVLFLQNCSKLSCPQCKSCNLFGRWVAGFARKGGMANPML